MHVLNLSLINRYVNIALIVNKFSPSFSFLQDNIFKLEDSHFENGRGKSPYDPKLLTASLLIGMWSTIS